MIQKLMWLLQLRCPFRCTSLFGSIIYHQNHCKNVGGSAAPGRLGRSPGCLVRLGRSLTPSRKVLEGF